MLLHHHHCMHIENESAEIVTTGDHEFEEIIEEYEEQVLVREEVLEPPLTNSVDITPAQGKPRCITVDTEFSPPCRGHTQQARRVRSMEQIRLASAQGWSILHNSPETCQLI